MSRQKEKGDDDGELFQQHIKLTQCGTQSYIQNTLKDLNLFICLSI